MGSYPVEIRRCQHIKISGAQCGSPALRGEKLCYYHDQNDTVAAELYLDGERYCDGQIMLPPFEDAHSIQMVLRHVVQLMLQKRIDRKDAGLMLYALQIASGNLKQMQAEKPRPTQVVVEPEKVEDTPMGMTPWSASGRGHDPENGEGEEAEGGPGKESKAEGAPAQSAEEWYASLTEKQKVKLRGRYRSEGLFEPDELHKFLNHEGPDPLLLAMERHCAKRERERQVEAGNSKSAADQDAPAGSIQACQDEEWTDGAGRFGRAPSRKAREGAHPAFISCQG